MDSGLGGILLDDDQDSDSNSCPGRESAANGGCSDAAACVVDDDLSSDDASAPPRKVRRIIVVNSPAEQLRMARVQYEAKSDPRAPYPDSVASGKVVRASLIAALNLRVLVRVLRKSKLEELAVDLAGLTRTWATGDAAERAMNRAAPRGCHVVHLQQRRVSVSFLGHAALRKFPPSGVPLDDRVRQLVGWGEDEEVVLVELACIFPLPGIGPQNGHSDFPSKHRSDPAPFVSVGTAVNIVIAMDGDDVTTEIAPGWSWKEGLQPEYVSDEACRRLSRLESNGGCVVFDAMMLHRGFKAPPLRRKACARQVFVVLARKKLWPEGSPELDRDTRFVVGRHRFWLPVRWTKGT
eukprot:TRINITY_DN40430_c0_g1_i1.p1 TRINITY_DN40430_c0_g1~~TRINITY_DN40430_c0_g1_i1.p1  ORF type:complete len:379 (+),score=80.88 TRINITY_DN40430_c0_g1_i1:86-1138(+)